jgi:hypothetical protein
MNDVGTSHLATNGAEHPGVEERIGNLEPLFEQVRGWNANHTTWLIGGGAIASSPAGGYVDDFMPALAQLLSEAIDDRLDPSDVRPRVVR